jgi:outer membrane protein assembly factor BamB
MGWLSPPGERGSADGVLLMTGSGEVRVIDARGGLTARMKLDLPPAAGAVSGDVTGDGAYEIVAMDVWGSVYCFSPSGARLWKHARESNATAYRLPVIADLDGDGRQEILVSDSRGALLVLNGDGVPEIVFGTEDKELYAVDARGRFQWRQPVDARLGRTLPVLMDSDGDGRAEVVVGSAYNQARPGLFSLDASTGRVLWKAESNLQVYQSAIAAGGGRILFADKNTRVYCVDAQGRRVWSTQVSGRGIFYALAVLDNSVFAVARDGALHVLDLPTGKLVQSAALEGGGAWPAALVRFRGESEYRLLAAGGSGTVWRFASRRRDSGCRRTSALRPLRRPRPLVIRRAHCRRGCV